MDYIENYITRKKTIDIYGERTFIVKDSLCCINNQKLIFAYT